MELLGEILVVLAAVRGVNITITPNVPIESWMERSEGELDGHRPHRIVGRKALYNLVNRK